MVADDGGADNRQLDIAAGFQLIHHQGDEGIRLNQKSVRQNDDQHKADQERGEPEQAAAG